MTKYNIIYNEDCLEGMNKIPDNHIDCVICDLPYGVTKCKWDVTIPLDELWKCYNRIVKPNGAIILFGQGLFTAKFMLSNTKSWRYNLIWKKGNRVTGFLNAKKMPLRNHEDIMIFYKESTTYNPQFTIGDAPCHTKKKIGKNNCYGNYQNIEHNYYRNRKFPKSIIDIAREYPVKFPTQKPVKLYEYLLLTYSNEGDIVLDNCSGSGTMAIAAINTGRNYICFEKDEEAFYFSQCRVSEHLKKIEDKVI